MFGKIKNKIKNTDKKKKQQSELFDISVTWYHFGHSSKYY